MADMGMPSHVIETHGEVVARGSVEVGAEDLHLEFIDVFREKQVLLRVDAPLDHDEFPNQFLPFFGIFFQELAIRRPLDVVHDDGGTAAEDGDFVHAGNMQPRLCDARLV